MKAAAGGVLAGWPPPLAKWSATCAGGQHRGVDRDLVDGAGEVVAGRAAPGVVAADPPVARVVLGLGVRVARRELAVDVELHAVGAHGGHHVVPAAVVVGRGGVGRVQVAVVGAEAAAGRRRTCRRAGRSCSTCPAAPGRSRSACRPGWSWC